MLNDFKVNETKNNSINRYKFTRVGRKNYWSRWISNKSINSATDPLDIRNLWFFNMPLRVWGKSNSKSKNKGDGDAKGTSSPNRKIIPDLPCHNMDGGEGRFAECQPDQTPLFKLPLQGRICSLTGCLPSDDCHVALSIGVSKWNILI